MAEDARYNIVFRGELVPGADPARVRENLGKLFKMDAARVEKLFAGKAVVLKKEADQATAMKMRALMKKAGAVCEMQSLSDDTGAGAAEPTPEPETSPQPQPRARFESSDPTADPSAPEPSSQSPEPSSQSPEPSSQSTSSGELETVGTIRTGGTGFSGEFDVAPAGSDMGEASRAGPEVEPDISHLSLAPPGTELEELRPHQDIKVPDISHLKVVDNPEPDA